MRSTRYKDGWNLLLSEMEGDMDPKFDGDIGDGDTIRRLGREVKELEKSLKTAQRGRDDQAKLFRKLDRDFKKLQAAKAVADKALDSQRGGVSSAMAETAEYQHAMSKCREEMEELRRTSTFNRFEQAALTIHAARVGRGYVGGFSRSLEDAEGLLAAFDRRR